MPVIGPEQLGRFFDEHARALTLYARQWSDAPEDVVQDAFVSLARQRSVPDRVVHTEAVVADRSKKASPPDPAFQLFEGLFPGMHGLGAQARLDRRVAALRVVESIRMYAATKGGALPESLDNITDVPVPLDPVTGKPFGYHLEGGRAQVSGPSGGMAPVYRLSYGITVVKGKEPVR